MSVTTMSTSAMEWLQTLSEVELYDVLQHLVTVLGYQSVTLLHGTLEAGKDIVFAERDKLGRVLWRAIQVKAVQLTGNLSSPKSLRSCLVQCEAALDSPYQGPNGDAINISEVWLVTPFPVTEHAKLSSAGRLKNMSRVHIVDGPALANLINDHLPELLDSDTSPVKNYFVHLEAVCDAPEEYLSARLRVRYSFQQVYVPPRAAIAVPTADGILRMPPLQSLASDRIISLDRYRRAGLLSGIDLRSLVSLLVNLRSAAQVGAAIPALAVAARLLLTHLTDLFDALSIPPTITLEPTALHMIALKAGRNVTKELLSELVCDAADLSESPRHVVTRFDGNGRLRPELPPVVAKAFSGVRDDIGSFDEMIVFLAPLIYGKHCPANSAGPSSVRHTLSLVRDSLLALDQAVRFACGEAEDRINSSLCGNDFLGPDVSTEVLNKVCEQSQILDLLRTAGVSIAERRVRCDAMTIADKIARIIFVGPLGIGKTTLLKQLCAATIRNYGASDEPRLPVFCSLGVARDQSMLRTEEVVVAASKVTLPGVEAYPSSEIDWVLDGFDEIESPVLRDRIVSWITSEAAQVSRCVLGSRPTALNVPIPGLPRFSIEPFSSAEVEEYVRRFPWADRSRAERLLAVLAGNAELAGLAQTPLIITLITLLCQHHEPDLLPNRRDELYERISRLLMGDWDVAKGYQRNHSLDDFQKRMALVERTAFVLYEKRKSSFTRHEFCQACLSGVPIAHFPPNVVEQLLGEIITDCLLTPASSEEYRFFHFSIHEYLAAKELARDITPVRLQRVLIEYFRSAGSWWEEVLVFYAGIKRDITAMVADLLFETLAGPADQTARLTLRLLRRMLAAADLTYFEGITVRGASVQGALRELGALPNSANHLSSEQNS
jgi:hypothetical protein